VAKAIELRPPRRRPVPAGQALAREPPEGAGPRPYGLSGDGPVVAVVKQPERETLVMPDTMIELGIDFRGDKRR
jgi:hypothetical protein